MLLNFVLVVRLPQKKKLIQTFLSSATPIFISYASKRYILLDLSITNRLCNFRN